MVELVHYKWHPEKTHGKKLTRREDYDIALVRLDYPAIDELSGKSPLCPSSVTLLSLLSHLGKAAGALVFLRHLDMWMTVSYPI